MNEKRAFIIVDVQNDFCPGGSLAVPGGDTIIATLNKYIEFFSKEGLPVFASRDWHPEKTKHFKGFGGIWPEHCVQDTKGAAFHPELRLPEGTIIITKGQDLQKEGYSAFDGADKDGKPLSGLLKKFNIKELYIGGLATDYCVRATVLKALEEGFKVKVLADAVKGVDMNPGDSKKALKEMRKNGAVEVTLKKLR